MPPVPHATSWTHRLNARVRGDGPRTLVFGHGFGTDQRCWDAQLLELQDSYRVITLDFPGATPHTLGAFDPTRHGSLFGFAEDLCMLMDELQVSRATYVGHSLGGMIGILASNGSDGVFDSLITLGTSARFVDDPSTDYVGGFSQQDMDSMMAAMRSDYEAWANGFASLMVGDANPYLSGIEFTHNLLSLRVDVARAVLDSALQSDHRGDVRALDTRLFVLNTRDDPAVPLQAAQWLARHGGASQVLELDARGHLPHLTAPRLVGAALHECLRAITDD